VNLYGELKGNIYVVVHNSFCDNPFQYNSSELIIDIFYTQFKVLQDIQLLCEGNLHFVHKYNEKEVL
jgi:hypothetical protein